MITTFNSTWSPRTGVHSVPEKSAEQEPGETVDQWIYTRGNILRVLGRFPDALQAIRDALAEIRRPCPRELHEPA